MLGLPERLQVVTGYVHRSYAESLSEFGTPRILPRSQGWILERLIPGFARRDAMGCYPLFACADWSQLQTDLEDLQSDLVSLALVTDPFGVYDATFLHRCFRDIVRPFKEHYVVDLGLSMDAFVHTHHRRYAQMALRNVSVESCPDPARALDEWEGLYANLIQRHGIKGIPAFSRISFARQMQVPGIVAFRALHDRTTVGMTLWYIQGEVGYYHLAAYSDAGYQLRASFALFWSALEHFASIGLRWLNLGAGAGVGNTGTDGLSRFKRGWSTGTRTAFFCGRVFDRAAYAQFLQAGNFSGTDYFPAYRKGEFGGSERHGEEGG